MAREAYIREIARRIGTRRLIWFGVFGGNARPFTHVPQFFEAYSMVGPAGLSGGRDVSLETLTGERFDARARPLQPGHFGPDREFYQRLYAALSRPAVAVTHEASRLFAGVSFLRREFVQHLGLFYERQVAFDHKPWVETELRRAGVRVLPWQYHATHDAQALTRALEGALRGGPVVIRASHSGGGQGLTLLRQPEDIAPGIGDPGPDGFIAVSPFLSPNVPLNINACIFLDGTISIHGPSLQLIGIPGSALSELGYCGNDFARVRDLDRSVLAALQETTALAGQWLFKTGYVGAFGVDAVVHDGTVYLSEVNPRFQGSSLLSSHLDASLDRPDIFLAHIAAFLGLTAADSLDLPTLAREQPRAAQIYVRNGAGRVIRNDSSWRPPEGVECWMLPDRQVSVHPRVLLCRAIVPHAVTDDGWRLHDGIAAWFNELPARLFAPAGPTGGIGG